MAEQTRGSLLHFIAKTQTGPFMRIAKGISTLGGNLNPQEVSHTYIDDSSSTVVTGFKEEWPIEGNIYTEDPAAELLHDMAWRRAKGDEATAYIVNIMDWKAGTATGSKKAYRQLVSWVPASDGGGDGGSDVTFSGSLKAKGAPEYGEAVIAKDAGTGDETCAFTAD